jgi:dTDP-L-rhamnose 4-epimerase
MRVLVTGGAGFIGSHTADALLSRGYDVRVVDNLQPRVHPRGKPKYLSKEIEFLHGDVRDKCVMNDALRDVDFVFHAAAYQDYMCDYSTFFDTNVTSTALIFEIIREHKLRVEKVILASSQAVYGEGQYCCPEHGLQMPEARAIEQLDSGDWNLTCKQCFRELQRLLLEEEYVNPSTSYGLTKLFGEMVAFRLGKLVGVPAVGLRYSITQGARQSIYNAYSGICRIFSRNLRTGRAPLIYEDGLQERDYVHIDDVVRANLIALQDPAFNYQSFNVGSGNRTTVLEYAKQLARTMGVRIEPLIPGLYRVGDVRHTVSGISKIERLGWKPTKDLNQIFHHYLSWMETEPDAGDYFTPALEAMKETGVVRSVREQGEALSRSLEGDECPQLKRA